METLCRKILEGRTDLLNDEVTLFHFILHYKLSDLVCSGRRCTQTMSTQTFLCDSLTLLLQGALAELQRLLRRAEEGDAWGGSEGQTPLRLHLRARAAISGRNADLCAGCEEEELCRALLDAAVKVCLHLCWQCSRFARQCWHLRWHTGGFRCSQL